MKKNVLIVLFLFLSVNTAFSQSFKAKKNYDGASEFYNKYPTTGDTMYLIKALKKINLAIKSHPKYKEAFLLQSSIFLFLDSCDKALLSINKSIEIDNKYAKAYERRSYIKDRCFDDMQGVFDDANIAITLNPNLEKAYLGRAHSRIRLIGDRVLISSDSVLNLILEDYNHVIKLNPDNIIAYSNRASFFYMFLKDTKSACADWKKLKELGQDVEYELYNYCGWHGE